jgi:ribulose-phosphate 3-epimerase
MKEKELIPACMPKDFEEIQETTSLVLGYVKTIQLDLMDGKYVPEKTWPFMFENDYHLEDLKKEDEGLPYWEQINYELDLMVERPELNIEKWLSLGASRIIFHYASINDWEIIKNIDLVVRDFTEIGVAITIYDNLDDIFTLIEEKVVDFVQVMGIARIGFQGEHFDGRSLDIIRTLREKYPEMTISIDGGVSEYTIPDLRDAGVNRFVSGSGVFGHGIVGENIEYLSSIIVNNN